MADSVAVIIGTYGNLRQWGPYVRRALESVEQQTHQPDEVIVHHGRTLAQARNAGAQAVTTDWLIFLDADDELDYRYIDASLAGGGDIRQPCTIGVRDGVTDEAPILLPAVSLYERNYVVVGAMQRRDLFLAAGGFSDYPALEDWELWLRLTLHHKARISPCPGAIYRVHASPDGRNQSVQRHGECYANIRKLHMAAWENRHK